MKRIEFKYDIGDRVYIEGLERPGRVISLFYGETGKQYQVAYVNDGERKRDYFYEFELSEADGGKRKTGY